MHHDDGDDHDHDDCFYCCSCYSCCPKSSRNNPDAHSRYPCPKALQPARPATTRETQQASPQHDFGLLSGPGQGSFAKEARQSLELLRFGFGVWNSTS